MMYTNCVHRTQILLEERQYAALKARGRREAKGLSELIRLAVDRLLGEEAPRKRKKSGLEAMCGIFSDPGGPTTTDHDEILYGKDPA